MATKTTTIRLSSNEWKYIADILESVSLGELADKIRSQLSSVTFDMFEFGNDIQFQEAWTEWMEYRKERKLNKYTPTTLKRLNKTFVKWGLEATIESINQSIEKGYQGLFEVGGKKQATTLFKPSNRADWIHAWKYIHPYDEVPQNWDDIPRDDRERMIKFILNKRN